MPTTRSASRGASANTTPSSSPQAKSGGAGTKRKAEGTPSKAKREKVEEKKQTTIEDTLKPDGQHDDKDVDMTSEEVSQKQEPKEQPEVQKDVKTQSNDEKHDEPQPETKKEEADSKDTKQEDQVPQSNGHAKEDDKQEQAEKPKDEDKKNDEETQKPAATTSSSEKHDDGSAVQTDEARAKAEASNVLEKGLIYFFFRGRVNIDDPSSVDDIQRSYILLRPLPAGAGLGDGPVHSGGKARILALPKKVLPRSPRDRFLCWVEEANASFDEIKKQHLARDEYSTRTTGTRHTPAARPAAEGIYAITATGRESHLAYILTVPDELGEVQRELGLQERGAFVTSVKNPETSAPSGTAPDAKADYSKEIMDDFRGLRWGRLEPRHLDHKDCQFLLIGEHEDGELNKSVNPEEGDGMKEGKDEPKEVMEQLEEEDAQRVRGLSGDDSEAIFKDLGLSKDEYAKVKTDWD